MSSEEHDINQEDLKSSLNELNEEEFEGTLDSEEIYASSKADLKKHYNEIMMNLESSDDCINFSNTTVLIASDFLADLQSWGKSEEDEISDESFSLVQLTLKLAVKIGVNTICSWVSAKDLEFLEEESELSD